MAFFYLSSLYPCYPPHVRHGQNSHVRIIRTRNVLNRAVFIPPRVFCKFALTQRASTVLRHFKREIVFCTVDRIIVLMFLSTLKYKTKLTTVNHSSLYRQILCLHITYTDKCTYIQSWKTTDTLSLTHTNIHQYIHFCNIQCNKVSTHLHV